MPTEAESFLDEDQEQGQEEAQEETQEEQQVQEPDWKSQFEELSAKMSAIQAKLSTPKQEAPKKPQLTAEQKAALKENPELIFEMVQQQLGQTSETLARQTQKERWDEKAQKEFPIGKDKDFERLVVKEIQDMIADNPAAREDPKLVYMASKMAMAGYKPKSGGTVKKPNDSALPPGTQARRTAPNAEKEKKDQQQRVFLKLAGWDDAKITKVLAKSEAERGITYKGNRRRRVVAL